MALGPAGAARNDAAVEAFASRLRAGRGAGGDPRPNAEWALVAGISMLIGKRVMAGEAAALPELEDELVAMATALADSFRSKKAHFHRVSRATRALWPETISFMFGRRLEKLISAQQEEMREEFRQRWEEIARLMEESERRTEETREYNREILLRNEKVYTSVIARLEEEQGADRVEHRRNPRPDAGAAEADRTLRPARRRRRGLGAEPDASH